jgi:type II secretory pathway pseudopilin PulG
MGKLLKSEKGSTIIETLVALAFIGIVSTSLLNMAIMSRKLSFQHRVKNELGQYANMIIEEIAKDYILNGEVKEASLYCGKTTEASDTGILIKNFLDEYSFEDEVEQCSVSKEENEYRVTLIINAYGKSLTVNRVFQIK